MFFHPTVVTQTPVNYKTSNYDVEWFIFELTHGENKNRNMYLISKILDLLSILARTL